MQEIIVKENDAGLRVFINGIPNLKLIPKEELEITITALERQIVEYYEQEKRG